MSEDDDLFIVFDTPTPQQQYTASSAPVHALGTHRVPVDPIVCAVAGSKTVTPPVPVAATPPPRGVNLLTHKPLADPSEVVAAGASSIGVSVITNTNPRRGEVDGGSSVPLASPLEILEERHSGIRVRRATASMIQLSVWLAQYPYIPFCQVKEALRAAPGTTLQQTCIGVITRKTDPKQGSRSAYAVLTVWSLQGGSPVPAEELGVLLGGSAFDFLFAKLSLGAVVAIANLAVLSGGGHRETIGSRSPDAFPLLKAGDMDQIRLLGYAANLGTCESVSYKSGERCHSFVNTRVTKHCSYHVADLRKAARGTTKGAPAPRSGALVAKWPSGVTTLQASSFSTCPVRPRGGGTRAESQQLLKQPTFLTVRGDTGLPSSAPVRNIECMGPYAGVGRGTPLRATMLAPPSPNHPSAQSMGVSSRGRDVLEAARQQIARTERGRLIREALRRHPESPVPASSAASRKRFREDHSSSSSSGNAGGTTLVQSVREQFAPLHRSCNPSFVPMGSVLAQDTTPATQASSRFEGSVVTQSKGRHSKLLSAVAKALVDDPRLQMASRQAQVGARGDDSGPGRGCASSATLLGVVADQLTSSNEHLLKEAAVDHMAEYLSQQVEKEQAIAALERITERKVRVTYCYQCRRGYVKLPDTCLTERHRLEKREVTQTFVQCAHCSYKASIAGSTPAWKIFPRCPRCNKECEWNASNAAPEMAAPREAPHPY